MSRKRKPSAASATIDQDRYGDAEQASSRSTSHLPGQDKDAYYKQLYAKPPDFKALARRDPDFAAVVKGRELDFNDPASVMQLTKTLLSLDFGLKIELPDDRLCPPVANRHNYILWLKGLLDTSSYDKPGRKAVGLDIGTGASCVYPLLGCTQRPWSFLASDIDEKSLEYARANVKLNSLDHRITILHRKPEQSLIPLDEPNTPSSIDFTMTNPPFYPSSDALLQSAARKSHPPHSACTGAEVEMVTPGGEVAFVTRIVEESLVLRERVQWYTAMFGFLESVTKVVERLRGEGVGNVAVTEFVQGSQTRRWAVGWSFGAMRPADDVARGVSASKFGGILPSATKATIIRLPTDEKVGALADGLATAIGQLDLLRWDWDRQRLEGVGRAPDNVWNRAWRRRMKREAEAHQGENRETLVAENSRAAFGFRVSMHVGREQIEITAEWLEGHDATVFESFQGYLKTTITALSKP